MPGIISTRKSKNERFGRTGSMTPQSETIERWACYAPTATCYCSLWGGNLRCRKNAEKYKRMGPVKKQEIIEDKRKDLEGLLGYLKEHSLLKQIMPRLCSSSLKRRKTNPRGGRPLASVGKLNHSVFESSTSLATPYSLSLCSLPHAYVGHLILSSPLFPLLFRPVLGLDRRRLSLWCWRKDSVR
jgi:hypothetical protein